MSSCADAPAFAGRLEDALDDPRLTGTARALAPGFAARLGDPAGTVASVAGALLAPDR